MMIAVIRIRGNAKMQGKMEDTLAMMHLKTVNNCAVIPKNETYDGMLKKTKDFITYGEIKKDVFKKMLIKWGRAGNKRINDAFFKEQKQTVDKFTDEFFENKIKLKEMGINPVFRLHPPAKGYEGIKRPFKMGGALGDRGEKINELLERMI